MWWMAFPGSSGTGSRIATIHRWPLDRGRGEPSARASRSRQRQLAHFSSAREIAEDPHGFILRQGWASLDFSEEAELTQLRRLYETLQLEIIGVIESLGQLRESPEYELWQISEKKPGVLDELAAERAKVLAKESAELQKEAERLAGEIEELAGEVPGRIG